MGRAARHVDGHAIMYADSITGSMQAAMDETQRRRSIQEAYNQDHNITPQSIKKAIKDITDRVKHVAETRATYAGTAPMSRSDMAGLIKELEAQMKAAAKNLEFEKAAILRDKITELRHAFSDVPDKRPRTGPSASAYSAAGGGGQSSKGPVKNRHKVVK
jgi:excinuclease ABC subunit B